MVRLIGKEDLGVVNLYYNSCTSNNGSSGLRLRILIVATKTCKSEGHFFQVTLELDT